MKYLFAACWLCCLLVITSSHAADKTYVNYGKLPERSMVVISPSGNRMAFRLVEGERDMLIVVDLTTNKVVSGANITGVNPSHSYFIDDDMLILVDSCCF